MEYGTDGAVAWNGSNVEEFLERIGDRNVAKAIECVLKQFGGLKTQIDHRIKDLNQLSDTWFEVARKDAQAVEELADRVDDLDVHVGWSKDAQMHIWRLEADVERLRKRVEVLEAMSTPDD